jgi:hypothetical protein
LNETLKKGKKRMSSVSEMGVSFQNNIPNQGIWNKNMQSGDWEQEYNSSRFLSKASHVPF